MNRWELLQIFVSVVDCGSFSAAAKRLDVSKSLVNKRISQLERRPGTQVLFRTTRQLSPTDAGETLFRKCDRLFSSLEEAEQSVLNLEDVPRGPARGLHRHPRRTLHVADGGPLQRPAPPTQNRRARHLPAGRPGREGYDLAVRYGKLTDSSLKARKVFELPHVVSASPAYFEAHGKPGTPDELRDHSCLVANFEPCATWRFRIGGHNVDIDLEGNWRSNNASALITACVQGLGISRLPELYVREYLRRGELVSILNAYQSDPLPVWLVYPNTRFVSTKVRMFIDFFAEKIEAFTAPSQAARPPA